MRMSPVVYKYVTCEGKENKLGQCMLKKASFGERCPGNEYAGVVCRGQNLTIEVITFLIIIVVIISISIRSVE